MPAGHVLGSAQVAMEYRGSRAVVSGDYKRRPDPTCARSSRCRATCSSPRRPSRCRSSAIPPPAEEIGRLLALGGAVSRAHPCGRRVCAGQMPAADRAAARGGLGSADLPARRAVAMCELYRGWHRLGRSAPATAAAKEASGGRDRAGAAERGRRSLGAAAGRSGGGAGVRLDAGAQRAKSRGVELPLVISDHADWDELTRRSMRSARPRCG